MSIFRIMYIFVNFLTLKHVSLIAAKVKESKMVGIEAKKSASLLRALSQDPDGGLVTLVQKYGEGNANGLVTVRYSNNNDSDSFLVTLDLKGLNGTGQVIISEATSCDADEFVPYSDEYEWDRNYQFITLGEAPNKITRDAFRFDNGHTYEENSGKTIVVFQGDDLSHDNVVGCGVLFEMVYTGAVSELTAEMSRYPGYEGDLDVSGIVKVYYHREDTFRFDFDIAGLEEDCVDCGIHIHEGVSCETHEQVKGHGWNSVFVVDLWTTEGGATYNTGEDGISKGYFQMYNAFNWYENYHHAVVIHAQDGSRLACGVLK